MQIVYGVNAEYVLPALVSIWSLQRSASQPVEVTIYGEGFCESHYNLIQRVGDNCGLSISVSDFDETAFQEYSNITTTRFPNISLLSLLLPRLVDGRCLFIDADTLVLGDVCELMSSDLGGFPIGACTDIGRVTYLEDRILNVKASDLLRPTHAQQKKVKYLNCILSLGFLPGENYFNSGVVVMDCDRIRSDCPDYVDLARMDKLLPYVHTSADQDRLNEFFAGKWFQFPLKWNTRPTIRKDLARLDGQKHKFRYVTDDFLAQVQEAVHSPKVWHFMGRKKPWNKGWWRRRLLIRRQAFKDYVNALRDFEIQTGITFDM